MILSSNVHISTLSNIKQTQGFHTQGQNLNSGMPPASMLCKLTVFDDRQKGHWYGILLRGPTAAASWKHNESFLQLCSDQWMHTGKTCVGTPTWQHISVLCSVLRFPSQQDFLSLVSDPRTKSDRNYFSIIHHSSALSLSPPHSSLCSALLNQAPLSITAPQPRVIVLLATPTNSAN
jgi:hypothetical protein